MKAMISPSMMCCDFLNLSAQIKCFEKNDTDYLHIDVMDGHFVPNIALGTDFARTLKSATDIPLDYHLMTSDPAHWIEAFPIGKEDCVSVHFETTLHLQRVLQMARDRAGKVLLALNPATSVELAIDVLDDIDGFLLMTVNPGFAGQRMVPHAIEKIKSARAFLTANGKPDADIQVDGNVSLPNAQSMRRAGANFFVLGSSALFGSTPLEEEIKAFRREVFF